MQTIIGTGVIASLLYVSIALLNAAYDDLAARMLVTQSLAKEVSQHANSGIQSSNPYLTDDGGNPVTLPPVLNNDDIARYREIFAFQKEQDWLKADRLIEQLDNRVLVGQVLADRYLGRHYMTSYKELKNWLAQYSDMPDAFALYQLAHAKKAPSISSEIESVSDKRSLRGYGDYHARARQIDYLKKDAWNGRDAAKSAWTRIQGLVRSGDIVDARDLLFTPASRNVLSAVEYDLCLWSIANSFFVRGMDKPAYALAAQAASRSDVVIPGAHWTAGIAAWRMGNYKAAARHFSAMANTEARTSAWDASASAFWAYRAYDKIGNHGKAANFLKLASEQPRTFYGILARKKLGGGLSIDRNPHKLDEDTITELYTIPSATRAVALVQLGETERAEAELRQIFPHSNPVLQHKLLSLAMALDIPSVEIPMGKILARSTNRYHDYAVYPTPGWQPPEGFLVDPSLVFAFARQESGFHAKARSHDGAMGIMQLMPRTAHSIIRRINVTTAKPNLSEPVFNISVGQTYLDYLMTQNAIGGNLIFLAAAYNAGPGKLGEWVNTIHHNNDPLLFMESVPYSETRNYIGQVMASYWIYSEMSGNKHNNPMNALISGDWPYYDGNSQQMADAWSSGLIAN